MKKITIASIILILIFNLILPKNVFAEYPSVITNSIQQENLTQMQNAIDPNITNTLGEKGEVNVHQGTSNGDGSYSITDETRKMKSTITSSGSTAGIVAGVINIFPSIINAIMTLLAKSQQPDTEPIDEFTIQDLVYNKFRLFDINIFNVDTSSSDANNTLKRKIALWYTAVRKLAIVISLCVLIYVGIRMALASVATDKAEYKNMLINWICGFVLIFLMQYLIVVAMYVAEGIIDILPIQEQNLESVLIDGDGTAIVGIKGQMEKTKGWNFVTSCILYWMLVYYQIKFFILYIRRLLSVTMLTVISPLICTLYPIDCGKGKKSKSFQVWFKELMVNIFIQPLHAILYLVFITSAAEIAKAAPLMAIIFLAALSRGEKIVKNIFRMRKLSTINSIETIKVGKRRLVV